MAVAGGCVASILFFFLVIFVSNISELLSESRYVTESPHVTVQKLISACRPTIGWQIIFSCLLVSEVTSLRFCCVYNQNILSVFFNHFSLHLVPPPNIPCLRFAPFPSPLSFSLALLLSFSIHLFLSNPLALLSMLCHLPLPPVDTVLNGFLLIRAVAL